MVWVCLVAYGLPAYTRLALTPGEAMHKLMLLMVGANNAMVVGALIGVSGRVMSARGRLTITIGFSMLLDTFGFSVVTG